MIYTNGGTAMGKTSNCLKMLQILSSGRVYKGQELADILETNVRNIAAVSYTHLTLPTT